MIDALHTAVGAVEVVVAHFARDWGRSGLRVAGDGEGVRVAVPLTERAHIRDASVPEAQHHRENELALTEL